MSGSAHVQSLASIETVQASLQSFSEAVEHAVATLDTEIRRVEEWLEHDCPRFWKQQIHEANEDVARSQAELHRCLMFPIADERPSCLEERAAVKKAQGKLAYCEEKLERARHWRRVLQQERFEYDGRMNKLSRLVEFDIARGVQLLARLIQRLEEYQMAAGSDSHAAYDGLRLAEELFQPAVDENSTDEDITDDKSPHEQPPPPTKEESGQ